MLAVRLIRGYLITNAWMIVAVVAVNKNTPSSETTKDTTSVKAPALVTTSDEQPTLPQSTVRDLLKAVEQCRDEMRSKHEADLACKDYPDDKEITKEDAAKSPEAFFCKRDRDFKAGKAQKILTDEELILKKLKVTDKTNKLLTEMQNVINNGESEHYGCSPKYRAYETVVRAVKAPLAKGRFDPSWMTDCFRPKLKDIAKDDQEFINVFGTYSGVSEESLRDLIRNLKCPSNRIDLDAQYPWKELEKLPVTLRQRINQFVKKTWAYIVCFWDIKFVEKATFRQVFDCEGDGKYYKKAVACANGQRMEEGFKIEFPATLRDYHKGRNGEGIRDINRATTVEGKPGIVTKVMNWAIEKACKMAGKLDDQLQNAGESKYELGDIPQLSTNAHRRKRGSKLDKVNGKLGYICFFIVVASVIAGGAAGGTSLASASGWGAGCGATMGAFIGLLGGCSLAAITIMGVQWKWLDSR